MPAAVVRTATLRLWLALGLLVRCMGMLPAAGPLHHLRLRPWSAPFAYSVASVVLAVCLAPELSLQFFSSTEPSLDFMGFMRVMWVTRLVAVQWCFVRNRRELCDLSRCVATYIESHPPSALVWPPLLGVALAFVAYIIAILTQSAQWVMGETSPEEGAFVVVASWWCAAWACLSETTTLVVVGPSVLVTMLVADVRRDCQTFINEKNQLPGTWATHDETTLSFWRAIRVRQRVLHDVISRFSSAFSWVFLQGMCHIIYVSALCYSHALVFVRDSPGHPSRSLMPFLYAVSIDIAFAGLCCTGQWVDDEHTRLGATALAYLTKERSVASEVKREVELLVYNIRRQRGRFLVCGMICINKATLTVVLGCILTYVVVLFQFHATMTGTLAADNYADRTG